MLVGWVMVLPPASMFPGWEPTWWVSLWRVLITVGFAILMWKQLIRQHWRMNWAGKDVLKVRAKWMWNSLLKKVMCLMKIVFISARIRKVPVSPYLIHWNIVLVLMQWLNGQKPWDVRKIINVWWNFLPVGRSYSMIRWRWFVRECLVVSLLITLIHWNHGEDFRKEMRCNILSLFHKIRRVWLKRLEKMNLTTGWILSLRKLVSRSLAVERL